MWSYLFELNSYYLSVIKAAARDVQYHRVWQRATGCHRPYPASATEHQTTCANSKPESSIPSAPQIWHVVHFTRGETRFFSPCITSVQLKTGYHFVSLGSIFAQTPFLTRALYKKIFCPCLPWNCLLLLLARRGLHPKPCIWGWTCM